MGVWDANQKEHAAARLHYHFSRAHCAHRPPPRTANPFLLPSLIPTCTHPRYLPLHYHHHRNLYIMLLIHLRPQLSSWLMKCATITTVHGNPICCQRPWTGH
ncbi:hypothetical protein M405DRAFT_828962, partial [Rhizopogon salebrosus TDB-379]